MSLFLHVCWLLLSCPILCDTMDCNPPGFSIHGILQARILEWISMPSFRGSSQSRDQTCISYVSCIDHLTIIFRSPIIFTSSTIFLYLQFSVTFSLLHTCTLSLPFYFIHYKVLLWQFFLNYPAYGFSWFIYCPLEITKPNSRWFLQLFFQKSLILSASVFIILLNIYTVLYAIQTPKEFCISIVLFFYL